MKKIISMITVLILLVSIIGCSSPANKAVETLVPEETFTPILKSVSQELTFLNFAPSNEDGTKLRAIYDKAKKKFEETHPDITVIIKDISFSQYASTVEALYKNGGPMDVILILGAELQDYAKKGILTDLNVFTKTGDIDLNEFFTGNLLSLSTSDGSIYGITLNLEPSVIGYNKEWFDKANIPYPKDDWTWEEFVEIAIKLQSANSGEELGKYGASIPFIMDLIEPLVLSKGGSLLSPDGLTATGYLDSKESVEAFKWLHEIIKNRNVSPKMDNFNSATTSLFSNQTGMAMSYYSFFTNMDSKLKTKIGMAGIPHFKDGIKANIGYVSNIGISTKSKNPKLAWEFIRLLAIDDSDITEELLTKSVVTSSKVIEAANAIKDPYFSVMYNQYNYVKKSANMLNKDWNALLQNFIRTDVFSMLESDNKDLQTELTALAKKVDLAIASKAEQE
ncbi:sugar ABC transporter substrate-binding protein [Paenibacillus psychroresistens]|uniref:Sugar ABC transporter substrate-binding protein n=1 Tax=Paenibacillus psychroresistens TaxID=1778678 RepID=A0A6B8RKN8_9BACL|nr:sugar ABC transporter substrate-binding protein [Paenibacillus psychroresistens]QGQ96123.1 sugar ABC transporter substrate-binding protein [Paenibacillus psychroresistens]